MLASQAGFVPVPGAPLPVQLPAKEPGKTGADSHLILPCLQCGRPGWFLAPGFVLAIVAFLEVIQRRRG